MTISEAEIDLLKDSLNVLQGDLHIHSAYFYDALFRRAPGLRALFRDDLEGQGMKFMTSLIVIVRDINDEREVDAHSVRLGEKHAMLGIVKDQFAPMEEALIDTMRNAMADRFTPELEAAWRKAYQKVSDNMIRGGGIPG